ncbi:ABC transporter ATP-binding protein [Pantoea sp. PNA 03-3]|uniref:ABC transporter ATP-binding protein n=1 Tax=Pantoea sp. PNA 03-3 TaxID=2135460 RepID=UPI000D764970|nr:ABC transporter ATP-binding protein [Pantoea sp. PNA 03-3]PXV76619.1 putative ABC transport system ATP-binding protein [Pantoea sp. PNA 03-3]
MNIAEKLPESVFASAEAIRLKEITYAYGIQSDATTILNNISLSIHRGETCAITGPSGAGKSTLLNLIGLLEKPVKGKVIISGYDTSTALPDERAVLRNRLLGFIFQNFNLLPRLNALENAALPLLYRGISKEKAFIRAKDKLELVGLSNRLNHRPHELSGGQSQRVAIARALVGEPILLLADEPTGNLDRKTGDMIANLLLSLNALQNTTLIMVTHDDALASKMKRRLNVLNGKVFE